MADKPVAIRFECTKKLDNQTGDRKRERHPTWLGVDGKQSKKLTGKWREAKIRWLKVDRNGRHVGRTNSKN